MKRLILAWVCGALVMASCGKSNASASDSTKEKEEKAVVADSAETKGVAETATVDSSLPKGIPATAKLADEDEEMAVYLNVEEKGKDIYDNDVTSVWVYWKQKDEVKKLLTTTKDNGEWPTIDARAKVVKPSSIHAVFEAKIQPYTDDKLMIQGCPDSRHVFSYLVDIKKNEFLLLPTTQGVLGFTSEEGYIVAQSYKYRDDPDRAGRFTVIYILSDDGKVMKTIPME